MMVDVDLNGAELSVLSEGCLIGEGRYGSVWLTIPVILTVVYFTLINHGSRWRHNTGDI